MRYKLCLFILLIALAGCSVTYYVTTENFPIHIRISPNVIRNFIQWGSHLLGALTRGLAPFAGETPMPHPSRGRRVAILAKNAPLPFSHPASFVQKG